MKLYFDIFEEPHVSEFDRDLSNVKICQNLSIKMEETYLFVVVGTLAKVAVIAIDNTVPDGLWGQHPYLITQRCKASLEDFCSGNEVYCSKAVDLPYAIRMSLKKFGSFPTFGTINLDTAQMLCEEYRIQYNLTSLF